MTLKIGRREYAFSGMGKAILLIAAVATVMGSCVGTIMHIVGWDFVSVRGTQLETVDRRIAKLDTGQAKLEQNQIIQKAELDTLKQESRRQSRYQCFIIRRTDPQLLEPDDPCQPVNGRKKP